MYLEFYGLDREPFHITPDPEFLYLSPSHKEALAAMIYGVEQRKGFIAVTGEVGLGKTTLLHSYLAQADEARLRTVFVFNANVTYENLLKFIAQELGVSLPSERTFEMLHCLHMALIEEYKQGHNVVLLIDEAQNMPVETLENLRMLSNLETSKEKLLQIILVGQPELEGVLDREELRQLRQRIAVRAVLSPLSPEESADYIQHRMSRSGGDTKSIFSEAALKLIVRDCAGIPRKINIVCDNALINGYGYMEKPVSAKIVKEVLADLQGKSRVLRWEWALVGLVVFASLAVILWFSLYGRTVPPAGDDGRTTKSQPLPPPRVQSVSPPKTDEARPLPVGVGVVEGISSSSGNPVVPGEPVSPASQEPPKAEVPLSGRPVGTSEPLKLPAPRNADVSLPKSLTPERETKAGGEPAKIESSLPPAAAEVQKGAGEKGRATDAPPDPSDIVEWLLHKRSTKDR